MTAETTNRPSLPTVAIIVSAVTIAATPLLLQVWALIPGIASLVLGILAFRRTRSAAAPDHGRGSLALALGVVAFGLGLAFTTIGGLFLLGSLGS